MATLYVHDRDIHRRTLLENWVLDQSVFFPVAKTRLNFVTSCKFLAPGVFVISFQLIRMTLCVGLGPGYGFSGCVISAGGIHHLWK